VFERRAELVLLRVGKGGYVHVEEGQEGALMGNHFIASVDTTATCSFPASLKFGKDAVS
jgi:hypothetical protein